MFSRRARPLASLCLSLAAACAQANGEPATGSPGSPGSNSAPLQAAAGCAGCKGGTNCGGNCGSPGCHGGPGCGGGGDSKAASAERLRVPVEASAILGPQDAPVTIIEFTDYQCPFCARAEATMQALTQEYGGRVRLLVKQSPLPMHANALPAAKAALAAGLQGKFWPMHQALFAAGKLDEAGIEEAARAAGVDVGHLRAAVQDKKLEQAIARDLQLGRAVGASGTPTFFINGRRIAGALPIEQFRPVIDEELAKAAELVRAGTRPRDVYAKLMEGAADKAAEEKVSRAPAAAEQRVKVDAAGSPAKGKSSAPVTVVVFSDFECPYCARGATTIAALEEKYGEKLRFVFKNKPLPFHPHAKLSAVAALAAGEQGRFWEFHDALFTHQAALDRAGLLARAEELKLDVPRFERALDAGAEAALAADEAEAQRLGVNGTPTFFVNGRRVVGAQPVDAFAPIIEEELAAR